MHSVFPDCVWHYKAVRLHLEPRARTQQGEQLKQQGRTRFIENHYPDLIGCLKDSLNIIKKEFKQGRTRNYDTIFDELIQRDIDGTLGMIKPLNEQIHNGLKRIIDHYIPALNTIEKYRKESFQEIPKKWILLLIEKEDEFPITVTPQTLVFQFNFIWNLWRDEYSDAKADFDRVCERNLNSEDNTDFLRDRIFREIEEEADKLWLPVQNGFNTLYNEMRDWIGVQAVLPMEESLAEITKGLRVS